MKLSWSNDLGFLAKNVLYSWTNCSILKARQPGAVLHNMIQSVGKGRNAVFSCNTVHIFCAYAVYTQGANYIESWPNTTSAWAGFWSRFDIPVDRSNKVLCTFPATLHQQYSTGFFYPQSNQSAGPVRFLIFCSTSISLLANLVAGRRHQWTAGAD
jgi:hypothetical protein